MQILKLTSISQLRKDFSKIIFVITKQKLLERVAFFVYSYYSSNFNNLYACVKHKNAAMKHRNTQLKHKNAELSHAKDELEARERQARQFARFEFPEAAEWAAGPPTHRAAGPLRLRCQNGPLMGRWAAII